MRLRRLMPVAAAGLAIAVAGCGSAGPPAPARPAAARPAAAAPSADRFDAARAWAFLRHQVEMGPRPAGSPTLRRLAEQIRARIPDGRFEAVPGHPGLRNVVGRIPGTKPAIVVGAHYDTKDLPGFVGAEDGAGGTAELIEVARDLRRMHRPRSAPEIRFAFFDGEENPDDADHSFYGGGDRGSKAYAARHARQTRALVLLDFVADKDLSIPREQGSDPAIWRRLRAAARRVGALSAFPPTTTGLVLDDHTPFTRRGIPAIDLIDFTYPCWHKTCDDLAHVSRASLNLTGETVVELLRAWR